MKIDEKVPYAEQAIRSITRHDDEPLDVRAKALAGLVKFIDREIVDAKKRETKRRAEEAAAAKKDVADTLAKAYARDGVDAEPKKRSRKRTKH